jgi:hypothetical protein
MRAVMVKVSSLEADHSLRPPLAPPVRSWRGFFELTGRDEMKVDASDAACSMCTNFGPPKPIVEFLYNRIIEARSGCA